MREGSLEAPIRHPIDWTDPDYVNADKIDEELRRVFDICHGCRRCFNLCDSFPTLFDLIDASPTGEIDQVESKDFQKVVDSCTLCDMCFMTKCPYVPPHSFNLDFPHLMLRYRHANKDDQTNKIQEQLAHTDRNGKLASFAAPLVNWATNKSNTITRPLLEKTAGIDHRAELPKFHSKTFVKLAKDPLPITENHSTKDIKVALFATCFINYNNPNLGQIIRRIMAHQGIQPEVIYPRCCGMPLLEQGNIEKVVENAHKISKQLIPWIDKGYKIITPVPSCTLMMRQEWPLLIPNDPTFTRIQENTQDVCDFFVDLYKNNKLSIDQISGLEQQVTLHLACHSRAQNIGHKAAELLQIIPNVKVDLIERCSGHGGTWGIMTDHFDTALKVGKPAARKAIEYTNQFVSSECPLAMKHLLQNIDLSKKTEDQTVYTGKHPLEIFAMALGID